MGYALLWVESLAVALLFVATVVAWLCRARRRPGWAWIDWLAYPVVGVLAVSAFGATWSGILGPHVGRSLDPSVLIGPLLLIAILLFSLVRAWQERASIRSWGVRVLALAATYLGMIGTAVYVRTSYATSAAWFFVVLMPLLVLTFVAAWLVLRGQRWWTKAELLLLIVAFPFVAAVNMAIPVPPWFYEVFIVTVLLVVAPAWFLRDERSYWPRMALAALAFFLPLAVYGVVTAAAGYLAFQVAGPDVLFYALLALTILLAIGGVWLIVAGLRRRGDDSPRAAAWPRGKLAIALVVATALNLMTFWNLDLGVRQRSETLRAEASALALSLAPPRVPDDENAAFLYDQVIETMGPEEGRLAAWRDEGFQSPDEPDEKFDPTSPKLRSFLKNHAPTLRLLHEATKRPACCFERDYGRPSINMLLPEVQQMRSAATLLAVDARCKAADGDLDAAMEDVNAMFALARHLGAEPLGIIMLVAAQIDTRAEQTLQAVLASQRPAAPELARIDVPDRPSYSRLLQRAFRVDEAFGLSVFADIGSGGHDDFRSVLASQAAPGSWAAALPWQVESIVLPLYRVFLLNHDLAGYRIAMERNYTWATVAYVDAKSHWEALDHMDNLHDSRSVICRMMYNSGLGLAKVVASGEARRGLARLALAACRYRAAHGRLPEKVDELLPEYIAAVPTDPFDGKPLKWKRTDGGGLVLYSIGPDMTDDGGKAFDDSGQTGDFTFALAP